MRLVVIALIFLFLLLQYEFWIAPGGVISVWKLSDHLATQQQTNSDLKQRNDAVRADIMDLKSGDTAIEERARTDLGMVKKGETFYQVINNDSANKK